MGVERVSLTVTLKAVFNHLLTEGWAYVRDLEPNEALLVKATSFSLCNSDYGPVVSCISETLTPANRDGALFEPP